jgi:N-acetylmuramoyl-L-alanine amidase
MATRRQFLGAASLLCATPASAQLQRGSARRDGTGAARRDSTRAALPLVVLDPGHGGADPGAIGRAGTQEKRIVLAVALDLRRRLEASGRCRVALTRTADRFVPLARRVEFARGRDAALLLSIHADAMPPGLGAAARGASVYTMAEAASDPLAAALARRENLADQAGGLRLPSVTPEVQRILLSMMRDETRRGSERAARTTLAAFRGDVPLLSNPHRRAAFVVLKAPDVPSALVELGFLSHPQDEALLNRPAWRARLAELLAEAVTGYLGQRLVT